MNSIATIVSTLHSLSAIEMKGLLQQPMTEQQKSELFSEIFRIAQMQQQQGDYEKALNMAFICKELLPFAQHETISLLSFIAHASFVLNYRAQAFHHIELAKRHISTVQEELQLLSVLAFGHMVGQQRKPLQELVQKACQLCGIQVTTTLHDKLFHRIHKQIDKQLKFQDEQALLQLPFMQNEKQLLVRIILYYVSLFDMREPQYTYYVFKMQQLSLKDGLPKDWAVINMHYAIVVGLYHDDSIQRQQFKRLASKFGHEEDAFVRLELIRLHILYSDLWGTAEKHTAALRQLQLLLKEEAQYCRPFKLSLFMCEQLWLASSQLKEVDEAVNFVLAFRQQAQTQEEIHALQQLRSFLKSIRHEQQLVLNTNVSPNFDRYVALLCDVENVTEQAHTLLSEQLSNNYYELFYDAYRLMESHHPKYLNRKMVQFDKIVQQFKHLAKCAPLKFEPLYLCLVALKHEKSNKIADAAFYYERACTIVKNRSALFERAVIYVRAALFYGKHPHLPKQFDIQQQLQYVLMSWGAKALLKEWQQEKELVANTDVPFEQNAAYSVQLIVTMLQSLAQKITLHDLLQQLLQLVMKHTSATASYFVKVEPHESKVLATIHTHEEHYRFVRDGEPIPVELTAIIDFVVQSGEPLMMSENARTSEQNGEGKTRLSYVCVPVFYKGTMRAVLYVENNLYSNAFNEQQLQLLTLISTHIAIALDHAEIYEELERRVHQRTALYEEINGYLQNVHDQLVQHEESLKQLFAGVTHQLRSPITSALGYIEAIIDGVVVDEEKQQQLIMKSKHRLVELQLLIERLFTFVSYETGEISLQLVRRTVEQFVQKLQSNVFNQYDCRDVTFTIVPMPQGDIIVDEAKLFVALQAIVDYLRLFQQRQVVRVVIFTRDGTLNMQLESDYAAQQEQLFDAYFLTAKQQQGPMTGLDIAISKKVFELHGGDITVEAAHRNRVVITIRLPYLHNESVKFEGVNV